MVWESDGSFEKDFWGLNRNTGGGQCDIIKFFWEAGGRNVACFSFWMLRDMVTDTL